MAYDEAEALSVDPFDGDFEGGGSGDRILSDKIVTARKEGPCHLCGGSVTPGMRARSRVEIYGSEMMRFRWCEPCCEAMAASEADGGEAYEARAALRSEGEGA